MSDFIIEDGVLRRYVGPGGDVVIPDGVTGIAAHAFLWCFCLKRVTIPASVREIRSWAFKGCASLSGVCLSEGLERIWPRAFEDCVSLREIWIPASVKKAWRSFAGCARLEAVRVAGDNPAYCDIDGVMYDRDLTRLIAFPWVRRHSHAFPDTLRMVDRKSFTCPKQTRIYFLCVASDLEITREMLEDWIGLFDSVHMPVNCERTVELRPMNALQAGSEPGEYLLLVRSHIPPEAEG